MSGARVRNLGEGNTLSRIAKIRSSSLSNFPLAKQYSIVLLGRALSQGERKFALFPLLGEGARRAGEGKMFAQQTVTDLFTYNKLDCHATARNDGKEVFPRPLKERGRGEGNSFAQQTETNLASYRPNVLTTSDKLDCFARPADGGNGARNDRDRNPLSFHYRHSVLDTESQSLSKGDTPAIADRASLVRNDEKTLVPQYLSALVPFKKAAFTLAEVLITLGIIGVVAAMTIPVLTQKYRTKVVETRLEHFYSMINQGLKMSELENGTAENWDEIPGGDHAINGDSEGTITWYKTYLDKYIKSVKISPCLSGSTNLYESGCVYFNNGSGVAIHNHVWFFYPNASKIGTLGPCGKDFFAFKFVTSAPARIVPYTSYSDAHNVLYSSCDKNNTNWTSGWLCTRIIEINGWKIPDDYPFRF